VKAAQPRGWCFVESIFLRGKVAMVFFVTTLLVGAVAGWMFEKQWGPQLVRWSRVNRMRMRVLRRQGENPWRAWFDD
jgi:hypothetical protein